jgi:cytochrome b561
MISTEENRMRESPATTAPARWHYAAPAIILHWTLAILIATLVAVGWYMMANEKQPGSERYFNLHKSVGIVVFALVLLRIVWRLTHKPAALPPSVPGWEVTASLLAQRVLYACMFLLPIIGFIGASYSEEGIRFFGLQLPRIVAADHDVSERFFGIHVVLAWTMVAIIVLHAAGGLKHLLLDKDGVFQRMWFRQAGVDDDR